MTSPLDGPFYFAWVDPEQNEFDPDTMLVVDEDIFDWELKHDEGQFPQMIVTVRNPRIGLLNAGRKLWAWMAYRKANDEIVPLLFGNLIGLPTDMFAELVQLRFIARPEDFIAAKQTIAETLKVRPYYDPVWLDDTHRDDPDAILEGWSALYHIDRVTHVTSISDILTGEDGVITFNQSQGIYESVKMELGECPLSIVQVQAGVQWTQRHTGQLPQPIKINVSSYTGGSFKGDWPKPGGELGGGWVCEASYVTDVFGTEHAKSVSNSANLQNKNPNSLDCSTESVSVSTTSCSIAGIAVDGHVEGQTGICDPFGFNSDGSQGVNIPMRLNSQGTMALLWSLNCEMHVRYNAKREYTEIVTINVGANVQTTVVSPAVDEHTELMKVSGSNVGLPLLSVNAWTNYRDAPVTIGTMILPNDRSKPGGLSYQIAVQAGIAGTVEPDFSDIPGFTTNDGTVVWASLGDSTPSQQPGWTDSTPIPTGMIVLYEPRIWNDASGNFEPTGSSCFLIALSGGTTEKNWVDFTYIPTATSNNTELPLPINTAFIPGPGQTDPYSAPVFGIGTLITDGTVQWMSLGVAPDFLSIPMGGTMGSVTRRSYFSSARGHWSVEYLIAKARARLRLRSRCVKIQWDAPFEDCLELSLRKNATIIDSRIPGGAATGKITSYTLSATHDGKLIGHVEIGSSVGYGGSVPEVNGTPQYTAPTGYMQPGYQLYDGVQVNVGDDAISYTPPAFRAFDDGLSFPLQFFPGIIKMTTPDQVAAVQAALGKGSRSFISAQQVPLVQNSEGQVEMGGGRNTGQFIQERNPKEYALEANPVACEIIIRPVTNGPFNGATTVHCTTLEIPQGINLAADSET